MTLLGQVGHRLVATEVVSLGRLKWFAIVLPFAALVALVVLLRSSLHEWLHESPGLLFIAAFLAICVFLFASVIFALIEDLEARVLDQNRELSELLARTDQQNAELSALLAVGRASASSVDLPEMLDGALDAIVAVTPAEAAELWLVEGGGLDARALPWSGTGRVPVSAAASPRRGPSRCGGEGGIDDRYPRSEPGFAIRARGDRRARPADVLRAPAS